MTRAELRENTFKLLYCNEFHEKDDMPNQFALFWENYNDDKDPFEAVEEITSKDKAYVEGRVDAIHSMIEEIDEKINEVADKWPTNRMSKVDLTILRLAYYEMKIDEDIPEKVAIDQAVELAKLYGSDESASFINGILAKLF